MINIIITLMILHPYYLRRMHVEKTKKKKSKTILGANASLSSLLDDFMWWQQKQYK